MLGILRENVASNETLKPPKSGSLETATPIKLAGTRATMLCLQTRKAFQMKSHSDFTCLSIPLERKVRARPLAIALLLLCSLTFIDFSYAAGRLFYDGFEDGTTNKWRQDDFRNLCQVVTASADGVAGPFAGTRMARCNWNGTTSVAAETFENLVMSTNYTDEFFIRVRVRQDMNLERTIVSPNKHLRLFFYDQVVYHDLFEDCASTSGGLSNKGSASLAAQMTTYFGGAAGDNSCSSSSWHKVEYWIKQSTGSVKVWHDGILVRNDSGFDFLGQKWPDVYLMSNWSDSHDATNYMYFDEFEFYSDNGTGAAGLMSDATIRVGPSAPQNLRIQ